MTASLTLTSLSRSFGATTALDNVTLTIEPGLFVGVIGRSGAGKSTMLWLINRLVDPSSGSVSFGGTEITALRGKALRVLSDRLGKPLIMRSAYRSPEHNRAVGGAKASKHMDCTAFDIAMSNHDPVSFEAAAREVGFEGFDYYPRSGFMHVDLGPAWVWGKPFPKRAVGFATERPPAREVLAQSRTLRRTGAAGVATVGAAGVEVAQEVLAEAQGAILLLVPYLDTLC